MDRNKELAKNTIIFGIGRIGTKLMQFILVPIYTYYLTSGTYNAVDLITSTVTLLLPFLTLCLNYGLMRFVILKRENEGPILRAATLTTVAGTLLLTAFLPLLKKLGIYQGREYMLPLLFFFSAAHEILSYYCKSIDKNIIFAADGVLSATITAVLTFVFLGPLKMGMDGCLYAILVSKIFSFVFLSIAGNVLAAFKRKVESYGIMNSVLRYSMPLIPTDLCAWTLLMSDRYMLTFMRGAEVSGIYSAAFKIPGIFNLLVTTFISALTLTAFKECAIDKTSGKFDGSYFESLYKKYLPVSFVCAVLVIFMTQPLAYLFVRNEFYISWRYTPFLLVAYVIENFEMFMRALLNGMSKTKYCLYSSIVGAVSNIILNYFLIKGYASYGAIAATIAGHIIVFEIMRMGVKKHMTIRLHTAKMYISVLILLLIAIAYINSSAVVRSLSAVGFAVLIVFYRKDLKDISTVLIGKAKKMFSKFRAVTGR